MGHYADLVPTTWLDPLLTGKDRALPGNGPWGCPDIERLLTALKARIEAAESNLEDVGDQPEEPWAECRGCGTLFPLIDRVTAWDDSDPSIGLTGWSADCPGCGHYLDGDACHGHQSAVTGDFGSCEDEPHVYEPGRIQWGA